MKETAELALPGVVKRIGFSPRVSDEDFACFFSVASGWGFYRQKLSAGAIEASLKVEYGNLTVGELEIDAHVPSGSKVAARLGRRKLNAALRKRRGGVTVVFDEPVTVPEGGSLRASIAGGKQ